MKDELVERLRTAESRAYAMAAEAVLEGNWEKRWSSSLTEQAKDNAEAADHIESLEAKLEKARERFGQVLAAPLIDHSDAHNSKDGVARQALKELSQ